jgi:hypothetical protein
MLDVVLIVMVIMCAVVFVVIKLETKFRLRLHVSCGANSGGEYYVCSACCNRGWCLLISPKVGGEIQN